MEGNFRKKIALKLKDSSTAVSSPTLPSEGTEENVAPAAPSSSIDDEIQSTDSSDLKRATQDISWDQPLNLIGRAITAPLIHFCEVCDRPILIYGRMKKCRHAFCRECVKKAAGECPKCQTSDQTFEEASMGSVHICCHGGGRYDNKGCGRSYLSQRDLDAHVAYRHNKTTIATQPASKLPPLPALPPGFFPHPAAAVPGSGNLTRAFPPHIPPSSLPPLGFPPPPPNSQARFPQPPGSAGVWPRPPGF